jgi:3-deoxy-D-manno-octulosonic-acid transferase
VSLAWWAYRAVAPCLGALAPAAQVFASPHERPLWSERMGRVSAPGGVHAWVHGASMGEANAVRPLVAELASLQPGGRFWLTATTRTGRARLAETGHLVSLAPIDAPQAVSRFLAGVRPERLFIVETELWPHWLLAARRQRIPVAIVSARLSARSVGRYARLGAGLHGLVAGLEGVLCQSETDRGRWLALGARPERTVVAGNLKNDALPTPAGSRPQARLALGLDPERPLLVLGSVRPGEPRLLARAWSGLDAGARARWQVVALARHARAAAELREEAARAGVTSRLEGAPHDGTWRWDDRSGVLNDYYRAADLAFVGGSLLPYGGHNPLEPAACGAAVLVGSHTASQAEGVRALTAAGAARVLTAEADIGAALADLLADDGERERMSAAGRAVVAELRGASRRAVTWLVTAGLWPVS